jgi:hypothetical protein
VQWSSQPADVQHHPVARARMLAWPATGGERAGSAYSIARPGRVSVFVGSPPDGDTRLARQPAYSVSTARVPVPALWSRAEALVLVLVGLGLVTPRRWGTGHARWDRAAAC